jgi:hypothetical protein
VKRKEANAREDGMNGVRRRKLYRMFIAAS